MRAAVLYATNHKCASPHTTRAVLKPVAGTYCTRYTCRVDLYHQQHICVLTLFTYVFRFRVDATSCQEVPARARPDGGW